MLGRGLLCKNGRKYPAVYAEFHGETSQENLAKYCLLLCEILVKLHSAATQETRSRQSSTKVERMLVRICMEKGGLFWLEAWSMDFNKKGVFLKVALPAWKLKKGGLILLYKGLVIIYGRTGQRSPGKISPLAQHLLTTYTF